MNYRHLLFKSSLLLMIIPTLVFSQKFECAFIQDKNPLGKSNEASCSMTPEKVYYVQGYIPQISEHRKHCNIKDIFTYSDYENFIVDTELNTISWDEHRGLTENAKPKYRKHLIEKQGYSEKSADEEIKTYGEVTHYKFNINNHHISKQSIYMDSITGKMYSPHKEVPAHSFIFSDNIYLHHLYIPEASGHAILTSPGGMEDSSWLGIKFGKCRKIIEE